MNANVFQAGGLQDAEGPVTQCMGDFCVPSGHGEPNAEGFAVLESVRIVGGQVVSFRGHPVRSDGRCEAFGCGLEVGGRVVLGDAAQFGAGRVGVVKLEVDQRSLVQGDGGEKVLPN